MDQSAEPTGTATRYAIYYLPDADDPLWTFGSAIIGYDAIAGNEPAPPALPGIAAEYLRNFCATPRVYGFHATLKAPFRLTQAARESDLLETAARVASQNVAVRIGRLKVTCFGQFLALVPETQRPELSTIAGACVTELDHLRAPLSDEERFKRLQAPLDPREVELLNRWGYPHVLDTFRFHMTLAGPMGMEELARVEMPIAAAYEKISTPLTMHSICVCSQPPGGRFRMVRRFRLGNAASVEAI